MPDSGLRILVPLGDPGTEDSLVRFASTLARIHKGELHLTHIVTAEDVVPRADQLLQRAAGLAADLGVRAFPHLMEDRTVTRGIKEIVSRRQCNMMVMGWYHEVEENAVMAARNRALTKAIDVETLILKQRDFHPARRILVPTGGGSHALMGIQIAHELARTWDADIEILRIARDPRCRPDDPILRRYCAQLYDEMRLQLKALNIDAPLTVLPAVDVVDSIVERVRKDDLVVLGASNDWRQEEYLAGSIPDEIAGRVPGSVLMVRSPGPTDIHLGKIFWEQTVRLNLCPKDKWDAITRMIGALIEEKQVPFSEHRRVLDTALERERESPTDLGLETAVPHAPIPNLPGIIGCLGICPDGVDFEGMHDEPVRYIFLLLTPRRNYRTYIPVLAQIAALMRPEETRSALLRCRTPSEVTALIRQRDRA